MTAGDIRDLFVTQLVREVGGDRRRWRIAIGEVRVYATTTHAHCNWGIAPTGSDAVVAAIERVNDGLRERHPIIDA